MKYEILIGILLVFLLLSFVNAKDISEITDEELENIEYFTNETVVEVNGLNFTIPTGFGCLKDYDINTTENDITTYCTFYVNDNSDIITISTITGDDIDLDLDSYDTHNDSEKETINGHEGLLFEDDGLEYFNYIDNDKFVILQAPDDDYFDVMIND